MQIEPERKYKVGDGVIYQGLVGIIEGLNETVYGVPTLNLVAALNPEMTCTAREVECHPWEGQEVDQNEGLKEAALASERIKNMINGITDKYYRDGNH